MSKPKRDTHVQIPDIVLRQLLTPSELRMIKNRFQIVNLLEEGLSIRKISSQIKVGTDTVVRVARMLERGNLRKFLGKNKVERKIKSNTPWIFGKSS